MSALKITLAIAVILIMGYYLTNWLVDFGGSPNAKLPTNISTDYVQNKIDSLEGLPINEFCVQFYINIESVINQYYSSGELGIMFYEDEGITKRKSDDDHNDQWKEILSKNLYAAYTNKFIDQAMFVFKNSSWNPSDLETIAEQTRNLRGSRYLESNSPYSKSLDTIKTILAKYNQIRIFVTNVNSYVFNDYGLNTTFPDKSGDVNLSREYIANNLDNEYVNNCTRLKNGLEAIPQKLMNEHFRYLWKKIHDNASMYKNYEEQPKYAVTIIELQKQLHAFDNYVYGANSDIYNNNYDRLDTLLAGYNSRAFTHFEKLQFEKSLQKIP